MRPLLETLLALAVMLDASPALAAPHTTLQLEVGPSFHQQKEGLYNGILYQGWLPAGRLGLERWEDARVQTLGLGFGFGYLANRFGDPLMQIDAQLGYGLAPRVGSAWGETVRFYLGGGLFGASTLYQFAKEDSDHVYWFTRYGLSILGLADWALPGGTRLTARLESPVLALASRPAGMPNYNNDMPTPGYILGKVHENLGPASFLDYPAVDAGLAYQFPIGAHLTQSVAYRFAWGSFMRPSPMQWMNHTLALQLGYTF